MIGDTFSVVLLWVLKAYLAVLVAAAVAAFTWLAVDSLRKRRQSPAEDTRDPVPDIVKKAALQCPHSLSCIETGRCGDRPLCDVAYADGGESLVLASHERRACPYCTTTEHGHACVCPVHCHLNSRYSTGPRYAGYAMEGFGVGVTAVRAAQQPAASGCR
jgi:hypothetical protein